MIMNGLAQRFAAQKPVAQPEHESGERRVVVDHDAKCPSGLENSPGLTDTLRGVGTVMHHAVGVHDVESVLRKRQVLGIGDAQIGRAAGHLAAPFRLLERCARKIDPGGLRPGFQPFQIIGAHADSDFKHSVAVGLGEPGKFVNIRFQLVARPGVGLEIGAIAEIARAAGIGVPEIADLLFQSGNWRGFRHGSGSDTSTAIFVKTAPEAKIVGPSTVTDVIETNSETEVSSSGTASALLPLSVIVPARNEAHNLPRCLASLKSVGEVYVIDSQSSDDTAAIAASHGAKVVQFHYAGGWPKKRQWAMDTLPLAYDWILLLDADEVLTTELAEEIQKAMQDPHTDGYYIALQMYFLGRRLRHSGASFWKLSLFRKGLGRFECRLQDQDASMADMEVHEHVVVTGATRKLIHPLIHHNVESLSRYIQKHNEYSNWEARVWLDGNRSAEEIQPSFWGTQAQRRRWLRRRFLGLPGSSVLFFFYKYVLGLGFLDGVPGLIYCAMQGIQFFHIKAKIYELRMGRN